MKITEINLSVPQRLEVRGRQVGTLKRLQSPTAGDLLYITFDNGIELNLQSAVDVSGQLQYPRVLLVEGNPPDFFALFGGERVYWVTDSGKLLSEISLFRRLEDTEYWTTKIIEDRQRIIIVYESGVLALDEDLKVRWHRKKFFNDVFVGVEGDILKFVQDHDTPWRMRAKDGADIS
jgi:hypothetical protein